MPHRARTGACARVRRHIASFTFQRGTQILLYRPPSRARKLCCGSMLSGTLSQRGSSAGEARNHHVGKERKLQHQLTNISETASLVEALPPLQFAHPFAVQEGCAHASTSEAYVTLFGGRRNDPSFNGLRVLIHTIRKHDHCRPIVVLVTEGPNTKHLMKLLECEMGRLGVRTMKASRLSPSVPSCLRTLSVWAGNNTQARYAFSVFNAWRLVQFKRVIWLEPDQFLLRPLDDLWARPLDQDSAGAAVLVMEYMPQCMENTKGLRDPRLQHRRLKFNTGVVLMRPAMAVFDLLHNALHGSLGSYLCTDGFQTLWNVVLRRRMECLHRTYNCMNHRYYDAPGRARLAPHEPPKWAATAAYNHSRTKLSCLRESDSSPHVVHFAGGGTKPWTRNEARSLSWSRQLWRFQLEAYRRNAQTVAGFCNQHAAS